MQNQFSRTRLLMGNPAIDTLMGSRVAVFGVGGVGGYVVEVLARSGVGAIDVIDNDTVCITNLNRQLIATHATVGKNKVDVIEQRILDINPNCIVRKHQTFYLPETAHLFDFQQYDYVVDCIDTVAAKIDLIFQCHKYNVPLLCSMGAAFKLDATQFVVTDIFKTINDPLAKIIRKKLRKTNIKHLKVVYSPEEPLQSMNFEQSETSNHQDNTESEVFVRKEKRSVPSSNAWVPATAGLIAGGEVVKDLCHRHATMRIQPQDEATNEAAQKAKERAKKMQNEAQEMKQAKR